MGTRTELAQSRQNRVQAARNEWVPGYSNRAVAIGAAAAVAGGILVGGIIKEVAEQPHKQAVDALQSVDSAYSGTVVLKSGAKLRISPALDLEKDGNVAEQVADNTKLVITDPAVVERGGDTWIAVEKIGSDDPRSIDDLADNTEWANLTKLSEQGLATVIPSDAENPYISIHVNEQGAFIGPNGSPLATVSTASVTHK